MKNKTVRKGLVFSTLILFLEFVAPIFAILNLYFVFNMLKPYFLESLFFRISLFIGYGAILWVMLKGMKAGAALKKGIENADKKAKFHFELLIGICVMADIYIAKWSFFGPLPREIFFKSIEMTVIPAVYALLSHSYLGSTKKS